MNQFLKNNRKKIVGDTKRAKNLFQQNGIQYFYANEMDLLGNDVIYKRYTTFLRSTMELFGQFCLGVFIKLEH